MLGSHNIQQLVISFLLDGLVGIRVFGVSFQPVKGYTLPALVTERLQRRILEVQRLPRRIQRITTRLIPIHHINILLAIGRNIFPTPHRDSNCIRIRL